MGEIMTQPTEYKPLGEPLRSWSCKGCTNICYRLIDGEVAEYCRPVIEKGNQSIEQAVVVRALDKFMVKQMFGEEEQ